MTIAPFSGLPFWALLILLVAAWPLLRRAGLPQGARNLLVIALSTVVIFGAHGGGRRAVVLLAVLLLFSAAVYGVGRMLRSDAAARPALIAGAAVALVVVFLCYFKYDVWQQAIDRLAGILGASARASESHLVFLGVSYFSFKFIHYLVECRKGQGAAIGLPTFLSYTLFFPSFFGGPINRHEPFAADLSGAPPPAYVDGGKRIVTGLFKKVVLANSLFPYSVVALDLDDPALTPWMAVASVYAYTFFVYFDFAGYSDLAIGSAKLVGIRLPENFDYPFFRRNLQQFWTHWHMSLTVWLTDYIYWPVARKARHLRALRPRGVTTANVAILITFMVCGLWHGDGVNFFLWGTYHGIGLAILNAYAFAVRRYFPRPWQRWVKTSRLAYGISNFVTVQFVVFGFLIFGCDLARLGRFAALFG